MEAKCDRNLLGMNPICIFAFRSPQHIFALSTCSRSGNISTSPHSPPLPCLSSNQLAPEVTVPRSTDNPALEKGSVKNLSFVFPSLYHSHLGKRSLAALASVSTATAVTHTLLTVEPKW